MRLLSILAVLLGIWPASAQVITNWTEVQPVDPKTSPIQFAVGDDLRWGFQRGWLRTAYSAECRDHKFWEVAIDGSGWSGRIVVNETGLRCVWRSIPASAAVKNWSVFATQELDIRDNGTVMLHRISVRWILFTAPNQAGRQCIGYAGAYERWETRGWFCGPAGVPMDEARAIAILRAIGFQGGFSPQPLSGMPVLQRG